jgi:hypothetical protein
MWSGGSNRRPPNPPRGAGRYSRAVGTARRRHPQVPAGAVRTARAGWPVWRRLRQRVRALWRWVIVRAVRGWTGRWNSRHVRLDPAAQPCEVKQFPRSSRWN